MEKSVGWIQGWFTGHDNMSPEVGRMLWAVGCLSMIVFEFIHVFVNAKDFDPISFGGGFAAILAGGGAAIAVKDRAQPGNRETTTIQSDTTTVSAEGDVNVSTGQ